MSLEEMLRYSGREYSLRFGSTDWQIHIFYSYEPGPNDDNNASLGSGYVSNNVRRLAILTFLSWCF
jgi:hypothetical protein